MKRIFCVFLTVFLLGCLGVQAAGAESTQWVWDEAGLLSDSEAAKLDSGLQNIQATYQIHVVIVTTNGLNGKSPQSYANDRHDTVFGYGSDGILLMLSMEDRDWAIAVSGRGGELFSNGEIYESIDDVLKYLSDDDYYRAFSCWTENLPFYLDNVEPEPSPSILLALVIGAVVALIAVLVMRSGMNTKRRQQSARQYLTPGSYHLRTQQDIYLYSHTTKTARPKNTGSSGGGGSRGGGSGKF